MTNNDNWQAPACLSAITTGSSNWHVQREPMAPYNGRYVAGHFALTGWGDALDIRYHALPYGRTPGRALRAFRRFLRRTPVQFPCPGARSEILIDETPAPDRVTDGGRVLRRKGGSQ